MEPLTDKEKRILALSLFGTAMRGGPPLFGEVEKLVEKLKIEDDFTYYAKDWKAYADGKKISEKPVLPKRNWPLFMLRLILFATINIITAYYWLYTGHPKITTYLWSLVLIISGAVLLFTPIGPKKR